MRGERKAAPVPDHLLAVARQVRVRSEKDEERLGDDFMARLGYDVIRLSQARASRQSLGVPDRKYFNPARGVAVWWEAKRAGGKQRPEQAWFQRTAEACGEVYVCGPFEALRAAVHRLHGLPEPRV